MIEKDEYPEQGELVLGTVDNIFTQGAFIELDEYPGKKGMLHISEMSLKWVRNIRDYVREGQKVVLQVLKINSQKGHIDLSLRRVSDAQRKTKLQEVKKRQRSEKIIEILAAEVGEDKTKLLTTIDEKSLTKYDSIYSLLETISSGKEDAKNMGLPEKTRKTLVELAEKNIKPSFVEITGYVELKNYRPDGIEVIKKSLAEARKDDEDVKVTYVSAPLYRLKVKSLEYKTAEKKLRNAAEKCMAHNTKNGGDGEFHREISK